MVDGINRVRTEMWTVLTLLDQRKQPPAHRSSTLGETTYAMAGFRAFRVTHIPI